LHILVVKLSSIGDLVHTLPAVAAIRRSLPTAEISWAVESRSAEILRGSPVIDNLIEIDTRTIRGASLPEIFPEIKRQARAVRARKYDVAIDFQGLLKSAVIARLSGAKVRWGFAKDELRESASRFVYTDTVEIPAKTHIIRKNIFLAAAACQFAFDDSLIEYPISTGDAHAAEAKEIIDRVGPDFAILNPAGGWVTKLWHVEKFGLLADAIMHETGMRSVIVTGPNEADLARRAALSSKSDAIIPAEPTLKGFYELARRARLYVGGDTGPTHIAIAAGAPVVALFGPTECWRNGSLGRNDVVVERSDISCRVDCHRRECSNWICMDSDVDAVMGAVRERLASQQVATS